MTALASPVDQQLAKSAHVTGIRTSLDQLGRLHKQDEDQDTLLWNQSEQPGLSQVSISFSGSSTCFLQYGHSLMFQSLCIATLMLFTRMVICSCADLYVL